MRPARLLQTVAAIALAALFATGASGCVLARGSGNLTTEERDVSGFDKVNVSGGGELEIIQGSQEGLTITAEDNLMPFITTEVKGDTLEIGTRENPGGLPGDVLIWPTQPIRYQLRVKDLSRIDVSGSVDVNADGLETRDFVLEVSGSSKSLIKGLEADSVEIDVSGSCDSEMSGNVDDQQISVSGSGDFNHGDLRCKTATISLSGSAEAVVWATSSLDISVSGNGTVKYWGAPKVTQDLSGSAKVESLGEK